MSQLHSLTSYAGHEDASVRATLRDGAVAALRPLARGEAAPLLEIFEGMSPQSRALRYLTGLSDLPRSMLSLLADVDGDRHVAWLAVVDGAAAGVARYVRMPGSPDTAEVAFEVTDRHQGRGLGTVLLDAVTTVAAARGVRRVQASMAPSNAPSRRLVERVGARGRVVDGLVEAEGTLRLLDPAVVDRRAVLRLACSASVDDAVDVG